MTYCSNCGTELQDEYEFCPECGQAVSDNLANICNGEFKKCKNCGARMPADMFYCLECGMLFDNHETSFKDVIRRIFNMKKKRQPTYIYDNAWKSRSVSLVLCIFLGMLGVHRFYEGKNITGIIYLCTLGLLGVGWVFDIFRISAQTKRYRVK